MTARLFLICALSLSVVPASADDTAQANKLFVDAVKLINTAASKQTPAEQLPFLEESLTKLNQIMENHPSTDLAVKLITGQSIGAISLGELTSAIDELKRQSKAAEQAAIRNACLDSLDAKDPECAMWLSAIVGTHLQKGDFTAALEAAMTSEPGGARDNLLRNIARHHARAGNLKESLVIVDSMETEIARNSARNEVDADLFQFHLQAGNFKQALAAAQSIEHPVRREQTLRQIAIALARAGNENDAYATVRIIQDMAVRSLSAAEVQAVLREEAKKQASQRLQEAREQISQSQHDHCLQKGGSWWTGEWDPAEWPCWELLDGDPRVYSCWVEKPNCN